MYILNGGNFMTLVATFVWEDKILAMSDSRVTSKWEGRENIVFDKMPKVYPIKNLVLATLNASRFTLEGKGTWDLAEWVKEVINMFPGNVSAKEIIGPIVQGWENILQTHGFNSENAPFDFLICEWENNTPFIYFYTSKKPGLFRNVVQGYVYGAGQEILGQYSNAFDMPYEEAINHLKNGFYEVMKTHDSVGGEIQIYELNQNHSLSKWLENPLNLV